MTVRKTTAGITEEATSLIETAMRGALKTIAQEAQDAKHLLADEAAAAVKVLNVKNAEGGSDHDFMLTFSARVEEKLNSIISDIKDLKTGTSAQLIDHEIRIKKLEAKTANYFITLTLYSVAMGFLISLIVYHLIR